MKNNKGFSLVELIVVIAIMAILAAVAVVSFSIYIEKAHESNDNQYLSNVKYFATLSATEHQFELVRIEVSQIVKGPEDIKLWIKDLSTGEVKRYTWEDEKYRPIIEEIYNAVGNWEFHKLVEETTPEEDPEIEFVPDKLPEACDHTGETITKVVKQPTCNETGIERTKCAECNGKVSDRILDALGHNYSTYDAGSGFKVQHCDRCGTYEIHGPDNMPLVPMG